MILSEGCFTLHESGKPCRLLFKEIVVAPWRLKGRVLLIWNLLATLLSSLYIYTLHCNNVVRKKNKQQANNKEKAKKELIKEI